MKKKKRGEEPRHTSGGDGGGETPEAWRKEAPPRHKWFRKRKKGGASRRSYLDDEMDDEADDEDAGGGVALCVGHDDLSDAGYDVGGRYDLSDAAYDAGEEIMAIAAREETWGMASAIDIYDCNPERIRDADAIRRFVVELCDLIEMKRFGETQVVHFGEDERVAGYSMVQLIETSLISAHFANQTNAVYLDVFSCKPYNPQVVREFSEAFFGGCDSSLQVALRR